MKHMEARFFIPKAAPRELRHFERRSNRTPDQYPKYELIPDDRTLIKLLTHIAKLNGAIKQSECPIKKTAFYTLKHRISLHIIRLIKSGQLQGWQYKFNGLEEAPGAVSQRSCLAAIEIIHPIMGGAQVFQFHYPVENCVLDVLFTEVTTSEIGPFKTDPHISLEVPEMINEWEDLLKTMEDTGWFIYEHTDFHSWVDSIRWWYPHLKIGMAKGQNSKLATMLKGGPRMQICGEEVCKFDYLRANFSSILESTGHKYDFTMRFKKEQ